MRTGNPLSRRLLPAAVALLMLVPTACSQMDEAATAATAFLLLIGQQEIDEAYDSASPALHAIQNRADFAAAMRRVRLDHVEGARFTKARVGAGEATVDGTVTFRPAGMRAATVALVRDGAAWKVFSVGLSPAEEGGATVSTLEGLSEDRVAELAKRSLLDFADAVLSADFTVFHRGLSAAFRNEHDAAALARIFRAFVDGKIDIRGIAAVAPVFGEAPAVDANGRLALRGHYPTRPSRVSFDLAYARDGGTWRLFSIRVSVDPVRE